MRCRMAGGKPASSSPAPTGSLRAMRPLHRSITFWSGILVMAFICWAWRDSLKFWSSAWHAPYDLEHAGGGLCVSNRDDPPYGKDSGAARLSLGAAFSQVRLDRFPAPHFIREEDLVPAESESLVSRMHEKSPGYTMEENLKLSLVRGSAPRIWVLFLPHWLILVTAAALWLGLLLWRARRGKLGTVVKPDQ